jgi:hypothetical protein
LHLLKECKNTSQERKDESFQERAAARKAAGDQRSTRSDSSKTSAHSSITAKAVKLGLPGEGRLETLFHSSLVRVVLPDLGADDNVIPTSLISELEAAGLFVPLRTLPAPMTVDLAVQGPGLSTLVTRQAKLTMELQLLAGPMRLRNVKWLVAGNDMDEVRLGRPLLNALGIDAKVHLAAVRDTFQVMDCETIPSVVTHNVVISYDFMIFDTINGQKARFETGNSPSLTEWVIPWPCGVSLTGKCALARPFPTNSGTGWATGHV